MAARRTSSHKGGSVGKGAAATAASATKLAREAAAREERRRRDHQNSSGKGPFTPVSTDTGETSTNPEIQKYVPGSKVPDIASTTYSKFMGQHNSIFPSDSYVRSYSQGYESAISLSNNRWSPLEGTHNATISFNSPSDGQSELAIPLYIEEISMDFTLGGREIQGARGKVYYASNFQQSTMKLSCQSANPAYYGKVLESIHNSQESLVLSRLFIKGGGQLSTVQQKGDHGIIDVVGYITSAERRYQTLEFSKSFDIEFTIVEFKSPNEFEETGVSDMLVQGDWHLLLASNSTMGQKDFVKDPGLYVYEGPSSQDGTEDSEPKSIKKDDSDKGKTPNKGPTK